MPYELFYHAKIQGRGEFVRLALEDAGADYVDVARSGEAGTAAMFALINGEGVERPPFAPPFLRDDAVLIAQTANILHYLGPRLGLAPQDEAARLFLLQVQLTVTDFIKDIHDTHHPIANSLYFEEQVDAAKLAAAKFIELRLPKYMSYFEKIIARNPGGGRYILGGSVTYADLSMFQLVAGLRYAFPNAFGRAEKNYPRMMALHDEVKERPRLKAYLASDRRIPFNEMGIFRRYLVLDS
jgi:glutathione S-transferase